MMMRCVCVSTKRLGHDSATQKNCSQADRNKQKLTNKETYHARDIDKRHDDENVKRYKGNALQDVYTVSKTIDSPSDFKDSSTNEARDHCKETQLQRSRQPSL